jgi:tight adherence protein B
MILAVGIFVFIFVVVVLCVGLGQAFLASRQKQQIRRMLLRASSDVDKQRPDLMKTERIEDALSRTLLEQQIFRKLTVVLEQSGTAWKLPQFLGFTVVAAVGGLFAGFILPGFSRNAATALIPAVLAGLTPLFIARRKRAKRLAKFEEQFPEALNFLSRSMRAGHAFSIGLEMLVADASEPLGGVFRQMLNDLHLGSSLDTALVTLAESVPLIDVRFFVSAVLLQQGTGGNLAEILDSMSNIIRERFRLKGQVKAASAHGRITGLILSLMPVVVAALSLLISPDYLLVLVRDGDGRKLMIGAVVGQIVGFFCIRKIVDIKV